MFGFDELPLAANLTIFAVAAVVIGFVGTKMSRAADTLADITGWGEAVFGAVFLGASTSLPGIVTSVTAAVAGHPELAFSNALGGIAAQTAFLAIADMTYPGANLEHAAPSVANMKQAGLLMLLLTLILAGMAGPDVTIWHIHPLSVALLLLYAWGLNKFGRARIGSTWHADETSETVLDRPASTDHLGKAGVRKIWLRFALFVPILGTAGVVVAKSGAALAEETGLSESVVGALFTAIVTSLPELVTSVAAVRQGALTLAIGGVIGGNCFDTLFVACADFGFLDGSLYHAVGGEQQFVTALSAALTAIMLLGLLQRERRGFANIGFESIGILLLYVGGFGLLFFWRTGTG